MPNFIPHLKSTLAPATPDNPGATSMTVNIPTAFRPSLTPRRHLRVASAVAAIPLITMLAACGGSSAPAAQATSQATSPATNPAPGSGGQGGARTFPGATGLIAAVSPGTLQVQSTTAQNTVVYTASTKFTQTTTGHVAAGDCVTVTGAPATGSTSRLTATSVRIVAKVNGACSASGAFGGGAPGGGAGSFPRRTGGAPSGAPSAGSEARRAFASATGMVSSTAGSTILVKGVLRGGQGAAGSATPPPPTTISITLPASATVTQTVAATSAAAVVGKCAIAIGTANSAGAINARSITISTPGPNGCNAGGFGGFVGRSGGSGGSGGSGSGTGSASGSNA
jgi:hypothetical protein